MNEGVYEDEYCGQDGVGYDDECENGGEMK